MRTIILVVVVSLAAFASAQYNYGEVIGKSLLFYEAQRSGKLPSNNRVPWRGDSMLNDGKDIGKDLTGGYYDAGDLVKFGFPCAASMTFLAWGLVDYTAGYTKAGELNNGLAALKWGTDYFIKAHISTNELVVQVGDGNADHASWGRPEDWTGNRPTAVISSSKPGSDVAGETAAALAAASIAFKATNAAYAQTCLKHATELYNFAKSSRGKYSDSIPQAASFYNSFSGFGDELAWAAIWLYRATNDAKYLNEAKQFYKEYNLGQVETLTNWDNKKAGVQVLLAKLTKEQQYISTAQSFCDKMAYSTPKTPKGLIYIDKWGPLRLAANAAFVCMQAGDAGIKRTEYYAFAKKQINYMLGDSGRSFVVGYGKNPPTRPHHRASSCPKRPAACGWNEYNSAGANPQVLTGALVGGPDNNDNYNDSRSDYIQNEVALDYNAGFTSALAGLAQA